MCQADPVYAGRVRNAWEHDFALLSRPGNDEIQLALFRDYASNPPLRSYLRATRPPPLAV
jgi:hypothetical protein